MNLGPLNNASHHGKQDTTPDELHFGETRRKEHPSDRQTGRKSEFGIPELICMVFEAPQFFNKVNCV